MKVADRAEMDGVAAQVQLKRQLDKYEARMSELRRGFLRHHALLQELLEASKTSLRVDAFDSAMEIKVCARAGQPSHASLTRARRRRRRTARV